uniref:Uncharacterized protein n=1 Tax=Steinernema glaseri TaxID=37863 RepID=A0A1I8A2C0_9BILA
MPEKEAVKSGRTGGRRCESEEKLCMNGARERASRNFATNGIDTRPRRRRRRSHTLLRPLSASPFTHRGGEIQQRNAALTLMTFHFVHFPYCITS